MLYKCETCEYINDKFIICKNKSCNLFSPIQKSKSCKSLKDWINARKIPKEASELKALSSSCYWDEIIKWANSKTDNSQWNTCTNPSILMYVIARLNLCRKYISLAACKAAKFSQLSYNAALGLNMVENYCMGFDNTSIEDIDSYSFNTLHSSIDFNAYSAMESIRHSVYATSSAYLISNKIAACNMIRKVITLDLLNEVLPTSDKTYLSYG